jgi:proline iminopeptidase
MALMVVLALVFAWAAFADIAYSRVPAVAEPCRDCATPVTANGYHLYYREIGSDTTLPPVVLLHGGPGHSSLSFKQSFDFLAPGRRVVYYDQRGSGNSEAKANPDDYTVEQVVEELESLRRQVIRADRIVVVGHSFGGALAQRYALAHPDHVAQLVLIGSVRINNGISSHAFWRWFGPALWSTALGFPPADPAKADSEASLGARDADAVNRLFDKSLAHEVLDGTGRVRFTTWRELSLSAPGNDYVKELHRLRVPTTVIYGAADIPYTGKPTAEALCEVLPDCRVIGFEHSGHWPFLEEPERFREVMAGILGPR